MDTSKKYPIPPKPPWLKNRSILSPEVKAFQRELKDVGLKTVCHEAACPNRGECWHEKSFTFILLGKQCTRMCPFCNIESQQPEPIDPEEPEKIADFISKNRLNHVVLTSVTRDDLPDGGATQFIKTITAIRRKNNRIPIELLIPDFGAFEWFDALLDLDPNIIGYNVETVERLYPQARPDYRYSRCLEIITYIKRQAPHIPCKSALLTGLGESMDEIFQTMRDLHNAGCDIFYAGQYLPPSRRHYPLHKYYAPEEYESIEQFGQELGFKRTIAKPLVRSSYQSWKHLETVPDEHRSGISRNE